MNIPRRPANQGSFANPSVYEMRSSLLSSEGNKKGLLKNYKSKKILIMGYSETGKSSIVLKFLYDIPDASNLGPEENYHTFLKYQEENFLLHLVDFAGIDEYTPIYANKHGLKVDGYIFVYGVDDRKSFEFVQDLRERLRALNGKDVPGVLVANKCDIREERQVSTEEGKTLSKALGIPYLEVSAKKHSTDVISKGKVFQVMLREIITTENQENVLKRLKNWDGNKVQQLYSLFIFGTILLALIGTFLGIFGISNLVVYPSLIFAILVILSIIIGAVSIAFKVFDSPSSSGSGMVTSTQGPTAYPTEEDYYNLGPLIYLIIGISFVVLVFVFVVSCLSKEIFIKKKTPAVNNRYATLAV